MSTFTTESMLNQYKDIVINELKKTFNACIEQNNVNDLTDFYGQMQYHLGWVDENFHEEKAYSGKFIRSSVLLLSALAANAVSDNFQDTGILINQSLPACASIELIHNFSLIHDDIVDQDEKRRHRPTLWKVWGQSEGINTGDGMFSLARLACLEMLNRNVSPGIILKISGLLDEASLKLCEGQHLDIKFEKEINISIQQYMDMIARKTGALFKAACQVGAILATNKPNIIESLADFGYKVGAAFQIRDDILGIWAPSEQSGKVEGGDIARRKKSLPVLYALNKASSSDKDVLLEFYQSRETTFSPDKLNDIKRLIESSGSQQYCFSLLNEYCDDAEAIIKNLWDNLQNEQPVQQMLALVRFLANIT